jgi:hypothetical protein
MIVGITFGALIVGLALVNSLQAPGARERVAALKQSLQHSQAQLRKYEWVETTIVSLKGDEKSRKQNRCYYGVDGKLQKVPVGSGPAQSSQPRGRLRGLSPIEHSSRRNNLSGFDNSRRESQGHPGEC